MSANTEERRNGRRNIEDRIKIFKYIMNSSEDNEITYEKLENEFGVDAFPYKQIIYNLKEDGFIKLYMNGYIPTEYYRMFSGSRRC